MWLKGLVSNSILSFLFGEFVEGLALWDTLKQKRAEADAPRLVCPLEGLGCSSDSYRACLPDGWVPLEVSVEAIQQATHHLETSVSFSPTAESDALPRGALGWFGAAFSWVDYNHSPTERKERRKRDAWRGIFRGDTATEVPWQ